jgi:phytoene synthase
MALNAFFQEMKAIQANCHELAITKSKLNWWQQEIDAIYAQHPRHPIGRDLALLLQQTPLPRTCFHDIITSTAAELEPLHFSTRAEQIDHYRRNSGAKSLLFCQLFAKNDQDLTEFAQGLGIALQLIRNIRHFGKDLNQGKCFISEEDLIKIPFSIDNVFPLIKTQADLAREFYANAMKVIAEDHRFAQVGSIILGNIYCNLLQEMENDHFAVLKQHYSLTPMRKLWIAWRTYHRERQRAKKYRKSHGTIRS